MSSLTSHMELLQKLIAHPAHSRQEEQRANFLETYLTGKGHRVERIHNNLLVRGAAGRGKRLSLLLNSHMDTVAPAGGWRTDPYRPVLEGDRLTGLGSNDAGASVVAMIGAFGLVQKEVADVLQLNLLISAEEEVSGEKGISSVWPELGEVDGAIVGEPTGMRPAVAERGLMVLDGLASGVAGHAARQEGMNAILIAMGDVKAISSLRFPEKSHWLPPPSATVTMISAGTGHNVVPDRCSFVVDVRSNDRYSNERMLQMIRAGCRSTLTPKSMRLKPSRLEEDHLLMATIRSLGLSPFGSLTLSDMALIPVPAVKMGPGDSARSHTAGEYILASEVNQGVEGYVAFLTTLARKVREKTEEDETMG